MSPVQDIQSGECSDQYVRGGRVLLGSVCPALTLRVSVKCEVWSEVRDDVICVEGSVSMTTQSRERGGGRAGWWLCKQNIVLDTSSRTTFSPVTSFHVNSY